jgi:hypothetical protein
MLQAKALSARKQIKHINDKIQAMEELFRYIHLASIIIVALGFAIASIKNEGPSIPMFIVLFSFFLGEGIARMIWTAKKKYPMLDTINTLVKQEFGEVSSPDASKAWLVLEYWKRAKTLLLIKKGLPALSAVRVSRLRKKFYVPLNDLGHGIKSNEEEIRVICENTLKEIKKSVNDLGEDKIIAPLYLDTVGLLSRNVYCEE